MKRFTQFVCLIVVLSMILAVPAFAAGVSARASDYFGSSSCYLSKTSSTSFQVWFRVTAVRGMDELGVSLIKVQRSLDGQSWETMQSYTKEAYSNLIATGTAGHGSYVTYSNVTSGYKYRAYVEFYAKDGSSTAYYADYTSSI